MSSRRLLWLLTPVVVVVLLRTAWICDDAFITFRTVDNFVHGYGLRWNVGERVQSFTHPLWMLVFAAAYAVTREPYITAVVLCVALSTLTFVLYGRWIVSHPATLAIGTLALLSSRAFVDYSTSGLENPMTHLLLIVLAVAWTRRSDGRGWQFAFWGAVGLSLLNRHDLAVLLLPPALAELWRAHDRKSLGLVVLGMAPFLLWEVFSTVYYGFPLPNTAYAKLNTGVSQAAAWRQGASYYLDSLHRDPVTLPAIGGGIAAALARPRLGMRPLAIGVLVYTVYVLTIGGDHMGGRFFAAPFVLSVALLSQLSWWRPRLTVPLAAALVCAAAAISSSPWPLLTGAGYGVGETLEQRVDVRTGIADERRFYYPDTGLLRVIAGGATPTHVWIQAGRTLRETGTRVTVSGFVGFLGFYAGPRVDIIDCHALTDPLLARLPADR